MILVKEALNVGIKQILAMKLVIMIYTIDNKGAIPKKKIVTFSIRYPPPPSHSPLMALFSIHFVFFSFAIE